MSKENLLTLFKEKKYSKIIFLIEQIENDKRTPSLYNLLGVCRMLSINSNESIKLAIDDFKKSYFLEKDKTKTKETLKNLINASVTFFDNETKNKTELGNKFFKELKLIYNENQELFVNDLDLSKIDSNIVRCPDEITASKMISLIDSVRKDGDTVGGVISGLALNVPVGLGAPVFDKLHADLAKAMMSINAVKGFEYGGGFGMSKQRGSMVNDSFIDTVDGLKTKTNNSGGIQGGISNGAPIYFRVAFKPVATIMQDQLSLNNKGEKVLVKGKGRHDPCVVPRAVAIVEAMMAMVLLDHHLRNKTIKL